MKVLIVAAMFSALAFTPASAKTKATACTGENMAKTSAAMTTMPDGPGKNILLNTCTVCHELGRVRAHTVSREEWEETLGAMLNEGAMLSEQDFPVLLNYLARNFGAR